MPDDIGTPRNSDELAAQTRPQQGDRRPISGLTFVRLHQSGSSRVTFQRKTWLQVRIVARRITCVIDALLRCWWLLGSFLVVGLVLVRVPQGFDTIIATVQFPFFLSKGLCAWTAFCGVTGLVVLFAAFILDPERSRLNAQAVGTAHRFSAYTSPALLGLILWFILPYLLIDIFSDMPDTNRLPGSVKVGFWLSKNLFILAPLPLVIMTRDLSLLNSEEIKERVLGSWAFVGLVIIICYFVVDSFALTFLSYVVTLLLRDLYFWQYQRPSDRKILKWATVLIAAALIGVTVFIASEPASRAMLAGPITVIFLAIGAWLSIGFLAMVLMHRCPAAVANMTLILLVYLLITGPFNIRDARLLAMDAHVKRDALRAYANKWLTDRRDAISSTDRYPVFMVTAEGGGVRSSYWTASLLSQMRDAKPSFTNHIFGISGVSGGSLGAAVFASLARQAQDTNGVQCLQIREGTISVAKSITWYPCIRLILSQDFLSPPVLSMLFSDAARSILRREALPDRASALEVAIEEVWRSATNTKFFSAALEDLWRGDVGSRVPILFLNATNANTGRRLVLSPLDLGDGTEDRDDIVAALGERTVRLSTAVFLSARFPIISPVANLPLLAPSGDDAPGGRSQVAEIERQNMRIVDGGYADNSGTVTAGEVLNAIMQEAQALRLRDHILPVALLIANDPLPLPPCSSAKGNDNQAVGEAKVLKEREQVLDSIIDALDVARAVGLEDLARSYIDRWIAADEPDFARYLAAAERRRPTCIGAVLVDDFPLSTVGAVLSPVQILDHIRQEQTARLKREFQKNVERIGGRTFDGLRLRIGSLTFPLG